MYHNYSHSLQKFSQYNAIEKNWMNEDRYRKDPRNQIIISTETNDKPRWTWQSDDTFRIGTNFILVHESFTHLKETCPTSCQEFQDWLLSTANEALTQALGSRWAANLPANASAATLEWNASWVIQKWYFRIENTSRQIFSSTLNLRPISKVNRLPRFRTPTSSPNNKCKSSFIPVASSGGSPASSPVSAEKLNNRSNQPCIYFSKTNQISYDTHQETDTNYNNSIITIQRLHLRKYLSRNIPTQHNQATLSNISTFNLHKVVSYTLFRKVSPTLNILFNPESTHIIISWRLTMCARRSQHTRRIPTEYSDPG